MAYDNSTGSEGLRTAFGVGYVVLVAIFAVRLLTKRARRSKTEVNSRTCYLAANMQGHMAAHYFVAIEGRTSR